MAQEASRYSTERRRRYRENEIAKIGLFEFNRRQVLNKAKRFGFLFLFSKT